MSLLPTRTSVDTPIADRDVAFMSYQPADPRAPQSRALHKLGVGVNQFFAIAVVSSAARRPFASFVASSFAQKCIKNIRGCSVSM